MTTHKLANSSQAPLTEAHGTSENEPLRALAGGVRTTREDLIVAVRLTRFAADPRALAEAILRALPPWPEALRVARRIIEADAAASPPVRPTTPFGAIAQLARRAVEERAEQDREEPPEPATDLVYAPPLLEGSR